MKTYSVPLSCELAAFADQALADGKFDSLTHLIEYALAQVRDELEAVKHQDVAALRAAVKVGLDQADRGELVDGEFTMAWFRAKLEAAKKQSA